MFLRLTAKVEVVALCCFVESKKFKENATRFVISV